jgi:hypothetical protein
VVILADVLHHEASPDRLIDQCARISRRLLIIKDHQIAGLLAWQRIALIDWAANAPYGVPCLYRYNTPAQWTQTHTDHGFTVLRELKSMRLYPPVFNLLFGRRLQYFAALQVASTLHWRQTSRSAVAPSPEPTGRQESDTPFPG